METQSSENPVACGYFLQATLRSRVVAGSNQFAGETAAFIPKGDSAAWEARFAVMPIPVPSVVSGAVEYP